MNPGLHRLALVAAFLALVVIVLGAYVRVSHAGLGCPDWPGCYGTLTVPQSEAEVTNKAYLEQRPLEVAKGWKEMVHRYFAGTLGLAILAITIWSWMRRRVDPDQPVWLPTALLALPFVERSARLLTHLTGLDAATVDRLVQQALKVFGRVIVCQQLLAQAG